MSRNQREPTPDQVLHKVLDLSLALLEADAWELATPSRLALMLGLPNRQAVGRIGSQQDRLALLCRREVRRLQRAFQAAPAARCAAELAARRRLLKACPAMPISIQPALAAALGDDVAAAAWLGILLHTNLPRREIAITLLLRCPPHRS